MNRCSNCGKLVPAGALNCQNCGMPLTQINAGGVAPDRGQNDQPELPSWLESLRAHEQSGRGNPNAQSFSAADLVDEGALPGWLRPGNADMDGNTSGQYPAWRPASTPAPTTEDKPAPARNFEASSLIDEQSLPAWMRSGQGNASTTPPTNIPAASLVQSDDLPDWMKQFSSSQHPSARPAPQPQPLQPPPAPQPGAFAASSAGISARDLLDQQALPPWMAASQSGQPLQPGQAASSPHAPATNQQVPPAGISASSLLDARALPGWMSENNQTQRPAAPQAPAYQPQPGHQVPGPAPAASFPANQDRSGMAASSLLDMNALPEWLRQADNPSGNLSHARPGRPESPRVPSRPRGEIGPQEQSEVAANVFSSMLGVAASAPYFPGQPANQPAMPPATPQQPIAPGMGWPQQDAIPPQAVPNGFQGMPPATPQAYMPGMGSVNQPGVASQPLPNPPAGMAPGSFPPAPGAQEKTGRGHKTKKGLFDAIRDFFFSK